MFPSFPDSFGVGGYRAFDAVCGTALFIVNLSRSLHIGVDLAGRWRRQVGQLRSVSPVSY